MALERGNMQELTQQQLKEIRGGGISLGALALIGAGIVFIIGIVDGYLRPLSCR